MTSISAKAFKNAYCICYSSMNPSAELASQQSRPFTNWKHIWRIMKQKYDKDDPGVLRILYHTAFLSQKSSNWSPQMPDRMLNSGKHGWFLEACRCHQIQNELNFVLKTVQFKHLACFLCSISSFWDFQIITFWFYLRTIQTISELERSTFDWSCIS